MPGEVLGGLHADVRDAEGMNRAPELALLGLLEASHHVIDGLFLEAIEDAPLGWGDAEGVDRHIDELAVDELFGYGVAKAIDVEALFAGEVDEAADLHLARRSAELVRGLLAIAGGVEAEFLQAGFEIERLRVGAAFLEDDAQHLRDDLAGLLDADGIAFTDILAGDLVGVVQGRAGDGRAGEQDGIKFGDRCDGTRTTDLHADLAEDSLGLVGRELERHRPVRELTRRAGASLVLEAVDLHHRAVGREGQVAAEDVELLDGFPGVVDALLDVEVIADGKAPILELRLELLQRGKGRGRFAGAQAVADDAKSTLTRFFGVEELHRARGEVTGIGVKRFAFGLAELVEALELGECHVDFAADLEEVGRSFERARNLADQADVGGHVIPAGAVAAGNRPHEMAFLESERDRHAVDFWFDDEFEACAAEGLVKTVAEGAEVGFVVSVVERQHRRLVVGLLEAFRLVVADTEVGSGEHRELPFQVGQLIQKLIEFEVGNLWRVLFAILVFVALDERPKLKDLIAG